jgi:hypothetical protein
MKIKAVFSKIAGWFGSGINSRIDPEKVPTVMIVPIVGSFSLDQILSAVRAENRELVVMGNRSPAFIDDELWLREASKFRTDPSLVLTLEKSPNKVNPLCVDPLIIVRRDFLVQIGREIQARTSAELAISLAMKASAKNKKVSFV